MEAKEAMASQRKETSFGRFAWTSLKPPNNTMLEKKDDGVLKTRGFQPDRWRPNGQNS